MEEENKVTLNDLKTTYKVEDGKLIKTGYIKCTGTTNYSLSTVDTITSLTMPITLEAKVKVSNRTEKFFRLYLKAIRLLKIYKRVKKHRIKRKLNKRMYEIANEMFKLYGLKKV